MAKGPTAHILTVGDELLAGDVVDDNKALLAARCRAKGIEVVAAASVRDRIDEIRDALRHAARVADICLVSGGLGPTCDDLTRDAIAAAFARPLQLVPDLRARLEARFAGRGRAMPPSNLVQAMLPRGAEVIANDLGSAVGIWLELSGTPTADAAASGPSSRRHVVVALPGVPSELRAMMPAVEARWGALWPCEPLSRRFYRTMGMDESALGEALAPLVEPASSVQREGAGPQALPSVQVHYRASPGEVLVILDGQDRVESWTPWDEAIRETLGQYLYAIDERPLPELVVASLKASQLRLAVAESCTGGGIARAICAIPGASQVFVGGVVAYANAVKIAQLGVPEAVLAKAGAVSAETALAMARGGRERLGADLAVATTGIAGPEGGSPEKPIGTVYIAIADASGADAQQFRFFGERATIQQLTVQRALKLVWDRVHRAEIHEPPSGTRVDSA